MREINAAFRQLCCSVLFCCRVVLVSIWFWPDPNYRAGPAALQLVGLQCRAPGAQSRCTETCYVRSRVPGDRLNADAGSVGSSALQVAGRLRAELEARVSSHSRWSRAGVRGHRTPGCRRLHSTGVRGHHTPGDRLTATCGGVRLLRLHACGQRPHAGVRLQLLV